MDRKDFSKIVMDHVAQPVMAINRKFVVAWANTALCAHLDLPFEQIVGKSCFALTHSTDQPCWEQPGMACPTKAAFDENRRARAVHKHDVGGQLRVEEIVATPLGDGEHVIEEVRDISELLGLVDGILSICAACKKVRDEAGEWHPVEGYIHDRTGADFSHGLCPACATQLYPAS